MSSNLSNVIPKFKPIQMFKGKPIVFNEFAHYLDPEHKSYRPIIIFYDEVNQYYYYVKAKGALDNNGNLKKDIKYSKPFTEDFDGEVFIKGTGVANSLLEKDSYVDCSQIFRIPCDVFENNVDKLHIKYINTNPLTNKQKEELLDGIADRLLQEPPKISYIDVSYNVNTNKIEAESLYLHPEMFNLAHYLYQNRADYSIKKGSVPDDFKLTNQKLDTVYSFRKEFIKSTFSNYAKINYELNGIEYTALTIDEFQHKTKNLTASDSLKITGHTNHSLYNDCSELLKKLKEDIKAKDRGGDGGMSM